jgi:T4 superinfection immunity protein
MLWTAIILCLAVAFYLLPTLVAETGGAEHATAIFFVNLLFGWTILGWLAALIWAISEKTAQVKSPSGDGPRSPCRIKNPRNGTPTVFDLIVGL